MHFSQTYQTKWHDCDASGLLRPSALLVYMQETANLQCRAWGYDLTELFEQDRLGFLLSRMMVSIHAPLRAHEEIEVRTWCPESRGLMFLRCFSVHRGGEVVATALSHWALMDMEARRMVRVSDFPREFPVGEILPEDAYPRKVHIPAGADMEAVGKRRIVYSDLDFNRHMNNTRYPDMICDFLPDMAGRWVTSLSLSYLREGAYGDELTVLRAAVDGDGERYLVRTLKPDGQVALEAEIGLSSI